jgi:hypothetical protein
VKSKVILHKANSIYEIKEGSERRNGGRENFMKNSWNIIDLVVNN